MTFTAVKRENIPASRVGKRKSDYYQTYEEITKFLETGIEVVRVEDPQYLNPINLRSSLAMVIKKYHMPVRVFMTDGKVYLERKEVRA